MIKIFTTAAFLTSFHFSNAQLSLEDETHYKGTVGQNEIEMTLGVPTGGMSSCIIFGEIRYLPAKKTIDLCSTDEEKIIETIEGKETGYFILEEWNKKIGETVKGKWYSIDKKRTLSVILMVVPEK